MSVIDADEMPLAYCDDTSVEIGFPSEKEDLIMEYAESPDRPTRTVYSFVPHEVVHEVIMKHGGKKDDLTL
jgi:hypothetical protein